LRAGRGRRRRHEEHENHERWLISYADFITLLFAFFVVMYAISSLNESKYQVLTESLTGVFNQPDRSLRPIPIGDEQPRSVQIQPDLPAEQTGAEAVDTLAQIADSFREAFGDLIASDQLTVRGNEMWIELELSSGLLFPSGDAIPRNEAFGITQRIAGILAPYQNPIKVEGFTDNVPIRSAAHPTNWELSAARAASIVRLLVANGIEPVRLAAVGYGEYQPVAENTSEEGRARNRRVVLLISRNTDVHRSGPQANPAASENGTQTAPTSDSRAPAGGAVNSSSPP
jgi:chemotaxis protein MotB